MLFSREFMKQEKKFESLSQEGHSAEAKGKEKKISSPSTCIYKSCSLWISSKFEALVDVVPLVKRKSNNCGRLEVEEKV